jgi:osmoprotectant transport system substrate-binding protein
MMKIIGKILGALLIVTASITSCGTQKGNIIVGSKMDTEGALLGNMIKLVLSQNGYTVVDKIQLGGTPIVRKALISGEIDLYPEYTGNGAFFFKEADNPVWKDAERAYARVKELDLAQNNLVWLQQAPANNTWAIAIRKDLAFNAGLKTLSDLAAYVKGGGKLKLAGSEEFVNSPAALPAFYKAYGFTLLPEQLLILSGGNTATTEKAASEGTDGVNAAMAYGTDGPLAVFGLVVLEDDKKVQPVYQPAPVVRKAVLEKYPELPKLLDPLFQKLDLVTLQTLNAKIVVDGKIPEDVAREWLKTAGFIK